MISTIRVFSAGLLIAVIGIVVPACKTIKVPPECLDPIGCIIIAPNEPIKLAVLQTLSGDSERNGVEQANTTQLVLAKRDYQLLGHSIELQFENDLCTPEGGANATLKVVADPQIVGILGPSCSGSARAASPIMSEAGLVMISSSNTAPSLTALDGRAGEDWHPGYFRVIYNDAIAGQTVAQFAINELKLKKAATLDNGSFYSQQLTAAFTRAFERLGGEQVLNTSVDPDTEDMSPYLTAIENTEAELVFMPIPPAPAARILKQVESFPNTSGVNDKDMTFFVAEELISEPFIQQVGDNGVGVYFAGPLPLSNPQNSQLAAKYEQDYGEPPHTVFYSFASDATRFLLQGIVRAAISEKDGTLIIGHQALRDKLYNTKKFEGVTGTLTCNQFGDCGVANFSIVQLTNPADGVEGLRQNIVYTYAP